MTFANAPLVCPYCANDGQEGGRWKRNNSTPFKLIESVIRMWRFEVQQVDGATVLVGDSKSDTVDWESGDGERLACMACFGEFAIPFGIRVDFI